MNTFIYPVEIIFGNKTILANSISLTFASISIEIGNESLNEIKEFNNGEAIGLNADIRISCKDSALSVHGKKYHARITGVYRCSSTRIESKLLFTNLDSSQKEEIRKTMASLTHAVI